MKFLPASRARRRVLGASTLVLILGCGGLLAAMVCMPGRSHVGGLPALTAAEIETRAGLRRIVHALSVTIGERHDRRPEALLAAAEVLEGELAAAGFEVQRQPYLAGAVEVFNLEVLVRGSDPGRGALVLGAHYDTVAGSPGADDNASGAAGLVELARLLRVHRLRHDVRFVLYANEEPPRFRTEAMGSRVHARRLYDGGVEVAAMIALESLGYFSRARGSQHYPFPFGLFYPDRGDFVAFVGNLRSRALVRRTLATFRERAAFPAEGLAAPASVPGVGWSDHASYWERGVPAVMVTDTAPFRNPHYHRATDTPEALDFDALARVVHGLVHVVVELDGGIE